MADGTSIRDSLKAAIDDAKVPDGADSGAGEALTPVAAAPEALTPEPAQAAAPAADTKPNTEAAPGAERDEHGRFKSKAPAEGAQAAAPPEPKPQDTETATPAGEGPQTEATRIPPSLPAAVKAQWADLKPEVQQAFVKLEDSVQGAKAEWGKKGERLNRYDEILGPHLDKWRMAGLDEFSGVQTLLAAQALLERNPVSGIVEIARSYGIPAQQLAQHLLQMTGQSAGAEGQQAQTGAPDLSAALRPIVEPLQRQVQTLEQRLAQQDQASEAAEMAKATAEVTEFASRPENMYFENVRQDVAARLAAGSAKTLQDAYEQAIWASPEIRPHLLAAQAKDAQAAAAAKAAEEAQRRKAASAQLASGSVTGSPAPGAQPLTPGPALPLRDELKANLAAARASV